MKEGWKYKAISEKYQLQKELRYEMDRLGFFEPGTGLRVGEIENGNGLYIICLKFDSIEQADLVLAKMNLSSGPKSVSDARKKTMVLMDDEGHVLLIRSCNKPMISGPIDFEKFLGDDDYRMKDIGIPKFICENCGHHWYAEVNVIPVYPIEDVFVVNCPKCNTPVRAEIMVMNKKEEIEGIYSKPSDMHSR